MLGAQLDIRSYDRDGVNHSHAHHQVVLPLKGDMEMEIEGQGGVVSFGQVALVAEGWRHSSAADGDNAFLILDRSSSVGGEEEERFWELGVKSPFVATDSSFTTLCLAVAEEVSQLREVVADGGPAGDFLLQALQRRVLAERPWSRLQAGERARRIIEMRCCDPHLDMANLADLVGLSASALHRRFKGQYGLSPMRYLTEQRMERAACLLASGDMPLAELGLSVGYGDQSAFTRAFRRHHGMPPARYRAVTRKKRHKAR